MAKRKSAAGPQQSFFFWPKSHDSTFPAPNVTMTFFRHDSKSEKWPKEKALLDPSRAFSFGSKSHDTRKKKKKKKRCFRLASVLGSAFSKCHDDFFWGQMSRWLFRSKCHDDFLQMSRWLFSNVTMTFFKCHDDFF